ncbi:MAG: UDP-N-acetylenolpyruvoylglucosamine reductase [Bacteroidetes bacterium GWF2_42_66]|nr:MAG: UDP-N-acetylenolpyruvoylglucosamine reductase [Bacteroidetes bacterium GWA2_42_15]OFY00374.1 MAG: UDP-N-acetylenolpyruvoylglucosamine reductase [Bacteroidetes bacterium GWE2_42_39]OFY47056.1 MAG: UDP-N-acetylenolpyruvoylglucosamine reductase [Bacteroidetes bacterium GWF2_42_66]HAZ04327.1 UDP-N-acetylenolpyruvoylglucosamine reductase [Marinilabiliales bacterium]HBL76779.1 UDP-N-acetylenolpyruvoylglucosamine reductase [Prolixibacteraceae bacterium]
MIRFQKNFSLKSYNTFGIDACAKYFFEFTELNDLTEFLSLDTSPEDEPVLIMGGGSNLLFLNDFDGMIFHVNIPGIKLIDESRNQVWIEAGAGVNWDELVEYSVFYRWGGMENLSLIPGKVGAAPVQNIGAYGVEAKDLIETVNGFDLKTMSEYSISAHDCRFAYRDSIFKHELKNRFLVTSVVFRLEKFPEYKLDYGDLKNETEKLGAVNVRNIRRAVVGIRESKLPDPKVNGNAGSFFKNPVVDVALAEKLKSEFGTIPVYPSADGKVKLAAGWLIDRCGWKGFRDGDAGVHEKQALVLVNYGNATGRQIFDLSEKIKQSVLNKFGVELEREVNVI